MLAEQLRDCCKSCSISFTALKSVYPMIFVRSTGQNPPGHGAPNPPESTPRIPSGGAWKQWALRKDRQTKGRARPWDPRPSAIGHPQAPCSETHGEAMRHGLEPGQFRAETPVQHPKTRTGRSDPSPGTWSNFQITEGHGSIHRPGFPEK